jgi:hypothetical protein
LLHLKEEKINTFPSNSPEFSYPNFNEDKSNLPPPYLVLPREMGGGGQGEASYRELDFPPPGRWGAGEGIAKAFWPKVHYLNGIYVSFN